MKEACMIGDMSFLKNFRLLVVKSALLMVCMWIGMVSAGESPTPVLKITFDDNDPSLVRVKECKVIPNGQGGHCLRIPSGKARARMTVDVPVPDIRSKERPFTAVLRLKADKGVVTEMMMDMVPMAGRRATKFLSAMHDGEWHRLELSFDPRRTGREYAFRLDWDQSQSPWRFMSYYRQDEIASQVLLPFAVEGQEVILGGSVGLPVFSVDYIGNVDNVVLYDRTLF